MPTLEEIDAELAAIDAQLAGRQPVSKTASFVSGVGQGASFGFGDELLATMGAGVAYPVLQGLQAAGVTENATSFDELYTRQRDQIRGGVDQAATDNPLSFVGGNIVGGAAVPMGPMGPMGGLWNAGLKGKAAVGAITGGAYGAGASKADTAEGVLTDAALGAGTGFIGAPVLSGTISAMGRVGDKVTNKVMDGATMAKSAISRLMPGMDDITIGIAGAGDDIMGGLQRSLDSLSDDAKRVFQEYRGKGAAPEEAMRAAVFRDANVRASKGNITMNPAELRMQDMARQGGYGDDARGIAENFAQGQKDDIYQAGRSTLAKLAGDDALSLNEADYGRRLGEAIRKEAQGQKQAAGSLMQQGRAADARVPRGELADIPVRIRQRLMDPERGFPVENMPVVQLALGRMNRVRQIARKYPNGEVAWRNLDNFRQKLGKFKSADPQEQAALSTMYRSYVDELDDLIHRGVVQGDQKGVATLKQGIGAWRDYKQNWWGQDGKALLGKIIDKDMTDSEVVSTLIGGGRAVGLEQAQKAAMQLRNNLGENSEAFKALKGLVFTRMIGADLAKDPRMTQAANIGPAFLTNVESAMKRNRLMDTLFTPAERQEILNLANAAHLSSFRPRNPSNPSGSGDAMVAFLGGVLSRYVPGAGQLLGSAIKAGNGAMNTATIAKALEQPLTSFGADTKAISGALRQAGRATGASAQPVVSGMMNATKPQSSQPSLEDIERELQEIDAKLKKHQSTQPSTGRQTLRLHGNDMAQRIGMAESSGNPNAKAATSSALGQHQFTDATWKSMVRKYGQRHGLKLDGRTDPRQSTVATQLLAAEHYEPLKQVLKREPTTDDFYLAHFLGAGAAKRFLKMARNNPGAPAAQVLPVAARSNRAIFYEGKRPRTIAEVRALIASKV